MGEEGASVHRVYERSSAHVRFCAFRYSRMALSIESQYIACYFSSSRWFLCGWCFLRRDSRNNSRDGCVCTVFLLAFYGAMRAVLQTYACTRVRSCSIYIYHGGHRHQVCSACCQDVSTLEAHTKEAFSTDARSISFESNAANFLGGSAQHFNRHP